MRFPIAFLCAVSLAGAEPVSTFKISGPYTHQNLAVYLLHGGGPAKPKSLLTLQEAMEQKKVVVYETGEVGRLAVENLSDQEIFLQSGDIVKGGQQDRVLSNDFIMRPKSGRVPVESFCVESGRWRQRGFEPVMMFASAAETVATRPLKMAVKRKKDQNEVWKKVEDSQFALAGNAGLAASRVSPTSLQLSLEDRNVHQRVEPYIAALGRLPEQKQDAAGFVFAVAGRISGGEAYASPELFGKMWRKLLKSSAVEAIAGGAGGGPPAEAAVREFLDLAERGRESAQTAGGRVKLITRESEKNLLFESRDGDAWVHRSYLAK